MLIGLFGKIAAGKSSAIAYFKSIGFQTIDLDQVSKDISKAHSEVNKELAEHFGSEILQSDGTLNRQVLADNAFDTQAHTQLLNKVMHRHISKEFIRQLDSLRDCYGSDLKLLVEIPLPDKAHDILRLCDFRICIDCPYHLRKKNALKRGMSLQDFELRDKRQASEEDYRALALDIIENYGTEEEFKAKLKEWAKEHSLI